VKLSVVILPCARWDDVRDNWRRADEWGLHAAYTYDHLSWRTPFREGPWFSMIPTLVAASTVTSRLRLGPLVTSPNFRHPLLLAKDLIALDDISNGRIVVGVGSGGTGYDATTLGHEPWSPRERHERFVEFTRVLDWLLRESMSNVDGPYYPVVDSRQLPGPRQLPRPPIYVSAQGPKTIALAAELAEGWVSFGDPGSDPRRDTLEAVKEQVAMLNTELDSRGRTRSSMHRLLLNFGTDESPMVSLESFLDWAGRYRDIGIDEVVVHWPVAETIFDYDIDVFELICREGGDILSSWQ
jgi:alkanesulfonate monooxygenase SsuD/methylene tetrahydromethanopterin reductase-like flavin-dependent oxidoreductase (luciferase family)